MQTNMGEAFTAAIMRREGLDCACGANVVVTKPMERVPLLRQLRWAWFSHLRDVHPDEYAKIRGVNGRRRGVRRGR